MSKPQTGFPRPQSAGHPGRIEAPCLPRRSYAEMREAFSRVLITPTLVGTPAQRCAACSNRRAGNRAKSLKIRTAPDKCSRRPGAETFAAPLKVRRTLIVGGDGIAVEEFLSRPAAQWLAR